MTPTTIDPMTARVVTDPQKRIVPSRTDHPVTAVEIIDLVGATR